VARGTKLAGEKLHGAAQALNPQHILSRAFIQKQQQHQQQHQHQHQHQQREAPLIPLQGVDRGGELILDIKLAGEPFPPSSPCPQASAHTTIAAAATEPTAAPPAVSNASNEQLRAAPSAILPNSKQLSLMFGSAGLVVGTGAVLLLSKQFLLPLSLSLLPATRQSLHSDQQDTEESTSSLGPSDPAECMEAVIPAEGPSGESSTAVKTLINESFAPQQKQQQKPGFEQDVSDSGKVEIIPALVEDMHQRAPAGPAQT